MRIQKWWLFVAIVLLLSVQPVGADDDDDEDDDDDGDDDDVNILGIEGEDLGNIALYLMVGTLAIIIWKPSFHWLRKNGPELFKTEPREFKRSLGVFNRRFMRVHNWLGFGTAAIGTIHGYVLEWHWTLWTGMAALWVLIFSGSAMQWKWPPKEVRRGARLLHLQRLMSVAAIVLLLVGHELVD